jgi:2-polyprenyl-6-methoxyphenol hydroxylase-like FAD-dependent oxidoreductase
MELTQLRVGIVGASLAGLSIANVLERAGARVTLFERGDASFGERGGGLGLALELARGVTGDATGAPPYTIHDRRRLWVRGQESAEPASIARGAAFRVLDAAGAAAPI